MKRFLNTLLMIFLLVILCPVAETATPYTSDDLWAYRVKLDTGSKFGYLLRKTGQWIIPPQFDYAQSFGKNGLAVVYSNGAYGLINLSGEFIAKPQFKLIGPFQEGMAKVETNGGWAIINEQGNIVINSSLADNCGLFSEGMARIRVNDKIGFVDKNFHIVIEPQYEFVSDFKDGVANVKVNGKWGLINKSGRIIIEPQYDNHLELREGLANVKIDGKWGCINQAGKIVIEPRYEFPLYFREGVAAAKVDGRWGFINTQGQLVIEPVYDSVSSFDQGLAAVKIDGKWGFINKSGRLVIAPEYDNIKPSKGVKIVCKNGKYGILDNLGNILIPFIYDDMVHGTNLAEDTDYILVQEEKKIGFLNTKGQWIAKPSVAFRRDAGVSNKLNLIISGGYIYDTMGNKINHYINYMLDGNKLLKDDQYTEAMRSFQAALAINPGDAAALLGLNQAKELSTINIKDKTDRNMSVTAGASKVGNADAKLLPLEVTAADGSIITGEERQAIITLVSLMNAYNLKDADAIRTVDYRCKAASDEDLSVFFRDKDWRLHSVEVISSSKHEINVNMLYSRTISIPNAIGVNISHNVTSIKIGYASGLWRVVGAETNNNMNLMQQISAEERAIKKYGVDDLSKWSGLN